MRSDPSKTTRRERRAARPIPLVAASLAALAAPAAAQADDATPLATPPSAPPAGSAPAPAQAPAPAPGSYGDASTPSNGASVPVEQAPTAPAAAPKPAATALAPARAPTPKPRRRTADPAKPKAAAPAAPAAPAPGPGLTTAAPDAPVPDAVLREFQIPPFLLPVYQAAATAYQVPWQVLAAINSVETDYGRNLNVSSAGAVGWMQFMPATWATYGVDANLDGKRDPMNPADAIFAAARYLNAAGGAKDIRGAVFAYNHAGWYVDEVMRRANALEQIPEPVIDSLTGLAEARFPVPGDEVSYSTRERSRRWAVLHGPAGRRVLAVADGRIVSVGHDPRLGNFVVLEDAYGNRFTYANLGSLNRLYAVPRHRALTEAQIARELHLPHRDPQPHRPATAGVPEHEHGVGRHLPPSAPVGAPPASGPTTPPEPDTVAAGLLVARAAALHGAENPPVAHAALLAGARALGLKADQVVMRPLRPGARVVAGTVLGHIGFRSGYRGAPVEFAVRPAGPHSPRVDAGPLLRGWRELQRARVFGPAGTSTLGGESLGRGKALLLSKDALARRVLNDPRIQIYQCGREDIASGQVDRRVLAVLEFLADSGLHPTVSALKCGHSLYTTSGNISEHSTGDAVDIAAINGTPIVGHQGPGSITDVTIRKLLELQGTMKPHQIISLMTFPGTDNTLALPDHYDHIHVGFRPEPGTPVPTGNGTSTIPTVTPGALKPGQWDELFSGLAHQPAPRVSRRVSRFAIPAKRPGA